MEKQQGDVYSDLEKCGRVEIYHYIRQEKSKADSGIVLSERKSNFQL